MPRPKGSGRDEPTRRWIAELVRQHGARGAAAEAEKKGIKISPSACHNYLREFYPGESADPAVRLEAAQAKDPPVKQQDHELQTLAKAGDPEAVLALALERVAGLMTPGSSVREQLLVMSQLERLIDRLHKMRREAQAMRGRRLGVLVLPAEGPPDEVAA